MSLGLVWGAAALWITLMPIFHLMQRRTDKIYASRYRMHRLTWVQRRYPVLRDLSWKELERSYDVDELYNRFH